MFNNFKRNLQILNKDAVETSWLKCLIDDVPKQKHLLILTKCLNGDYSNINPKEALRKITTRMNHPQKATNSLKTYYLIHMLQQFLLPYITEKTIEQSTKNSADAVLANVANLYYCYLKSFSNCFEQINILFKMHRQLEILILKLDIPILQCIAQKLIIDTLLLYDQIQQSNEQIKKVRATKQIKRFLEIKKYIQLSEELLQKINSLRFDEIIQSYEIQPLQNNFIDNIKPIIHLKPPSKQKLTLNLATVRDNKMLTSQNEFDDSDQKQTQEPILHKSLNPSPNRVRYGTKTPNRAISIRDNFFVPQQGPLSFIVMQ